MIMRLALVFAALSALLFAACGGDDDSGSNGDGSGDDPSQTPSGGEIPATDEDYLRVFCTGITNFRVALNTEPREGLVRVVEEYRDSMANVVPPADLVEFHDAFLEYLDDAVEEPTALITRDPPEPPEGARSRLADKTDDVPECEYPTFLSGDSQ